MTVLRFVLAIFGLWTALAWQQSVVGQSLFLGQRADLTIVLVCLVGVRTRPALGAVYGFVAGVAHGGAAGADLTAFAATRTLLGFFSSFVARSSLQFSPYMTGLVALVGTLVAQGLLLFMAPPPDIGHFLGATLGTAIFNGVLAGLTDALLRRTLDPKED